MQLAITLLGKKSTAFIAEILAAIATHKCNILELRLSDFSHSATAAYLLVEGSWNCLAKLETALDNLQKRLDIKIHSLHTLSQQVVCDYMPYSLEIISINHDAILQDVLVFLSSHRIVIEQIKASCYPASYTQTPLFSAKFIILVPLDIHLLSFREEILSFCDDSNVDAIFEPIKR
jgi:glycine cleavage system transcriptional repressor